MANTMKQKRRRIWPIVMGVVAAGFWVALPIAVAIVLINHGEVVLGVLQLVAATTLATLVSVAAANE